MQLVFLRRSSYFCDVILQENIANVITTIQANKITEDASQAMQGVTFR